MKYSMAKFAILSMAIVFASGCATKPPSCSDQASVDLLKELFLQVVDGQWDKTGNGVSNQLSVKVSNIRTTGFDESAKKYTCEAVLYAEIKPVPESPVMRDMDGVKSVVSEAKRNIEIFKEIYEGGNNLQFKYGQEAAVDYMSNMQKFAGTFGGKYLGKTGATSIGNIGFSGNVKYISTISQDEGGRKRHYVEATGIEDIAAAYPVIITTHVIMLREKLGQDQ